MTKELKNAVIASAAKQSNGSPRRTGSARDDNAATVRASLRDLRLAPRKVALVAALVRDRSVDDALIILSHTPKRAAKPLAKLIASARANATNNHGLRAEGLRIASLSVTAGPRFKRYRPVSRGRAHPFQKRTSHIFVEIIGDIKPAKVIAKNEEMKQSSTAKTNSGSPRRTNSARDDKKGDK